MKIHEIHIENFRSIRSVNISFDHNCLVLLGKNEAGKSNVLKAIAALFGQYEIKNKDQRKKINNEKIFDRRIYATFDYTTDDIEKIESAILKKYPIIKDLTFKGGHSLVNFIKKELSYIVYNINVMDGAKPCCIHLTGKQLDVIPEKNIYQNNTAYSFQPIGTKIELYDIVTTEIQRLYSEHPYKCLFWHYDNNLLLPDSINIDQFKTNPSICKPLENIFKMCGRTDIAQEFKEAINQDGDYFNLLDQVSKGVTRIFREIWNDFKDTSIELIPNGPNINIKVTDKAKYSFTDRSDGFKKFISILLNLSTKSRSGNIKEKDIILIDEPDQSLYPTSARYLKDELLKISEQSLVIYSTHSQYMIDSDCIERHLIVEKKNDITFIQKGTKESPFTNDELLRQAIGCSIFECLQERNLIFEGWLDKQFFDKYISMQPRNKFSNIGKTFLHGISGADTLASIMIMANKKFLIIADSDKASTSKRKDFIKSFPEHNDNWIAYGDTDKSIYTLEDFIKSEMIENVIHNDGNTDFKYDGSKNAIENIDFCYTDKEKKQIIKKKIVESISNKVEIKSSYSSFVEDVYNRLMQL